MPLLLLVGTMCASCFLDQDPVRPTGRPVEVNVNQSTPDGCARFQVAANPGEIPHIDTVYNTAGCPVDELQLIGDTVPHFDASTGTLRIAVVIKNVGTRAVKGPVLIRFYSDSVKLLLANGEVVQTPSDIVGLGDSTSNGGRIAYWRYDAVLQPGSAFQVLMPGATSGRRWLELRGTNWDKKVRAKVFVGAAYGEEILGAPPDSVPKTLLLRFARITPIGGGLEFLSDHVLVGFDPSMSLGERSNVINSVAGAVVGGYPNFGSGLYLLRLPHDSSGANVLAAVTLLKARAGVRVAMKYYTASLGPTYRLPNDGPLWGRGSWRVSAESLLKPAALRPHWALEYVRSPLAWGCVTEDSSVRVGIVDNGIRISNNPDLLQPLDSIRRANLPGDTLRHGTQVWSVLASRSNNDSGIAGMAWIARISASDPTVLDSLGGPAYTPKGKRIVPPTDVALAIDDLAKTSRIVNLSLGADDSAIVKSATDSSDARVLVGSLAWSLKFVGRVVPLLVVSAGNVSGADPAGSLFPLLRDSLPGQTIVVAAMARDSTLLYAPTGSH